MSGIQLASSQSIRPFKSSEEYVYAMKEDLAEWLKDLYGMDINVKNIVQMLQTGSLLCLHANKVTHAAADFLHRHGSAHMELPTSGVSFISSAQHSTFQARDNVSNFINWCRTQMHVKDALMFETDDLVLRKNEKNVVLCLLEVARRASRFGMAAPVLIQLEQEIEEEMRVEKDSHMQEAVQSVVVPYRLTDTQNLDEMVQRLINRCTCPAQFPMVKISEGKYRVGDSNTLIFVRILRKHVMVRVGGGWDTLEHYLDKHDPCRCTSLSHKLAQYPHTPVHEIKARQCGPDGQTTSQSSLLLSRVQSPLDPVTWTSATPSRIHRSDIVLWNGPAPTKLKNLFSDAKDDSVIKCKTSREPNRSSPDQHLSSSLPQPTQPDTQRPNTPLVLQKVESQTISKPLQDPDNRFDQTWSKTQFVSKLRQNTSARTKNHQELQSVLAKPAGSGSAKPFQAVNTNKNSLSNHQLANISTQESENNGNSRKRPDFIHTFCSSSGPVGIISGEAHAKHLESTAKGHSSNSAQIESTVYGNERCLHSSQGDWTHLPMHMVPNSLINESKSNSNVTILEPSKTQSIVDVSEKNGNLAIKSLFTPPPISPAQEAILYQNLEEEILSNLKQLSMDSDGCNSENEQNSSPEILLNSPQSLNECQKHLIPNIFTNNARFEAIPDEPSKEMRLSDRVSVERWVNISRDFKETKQESYITTEPSQLKVSRSSSSWSTLSSSMDSKDLIKAATVSDTDQIVETDLTPINSSIYKTISDKRRSLKKPERVPSIYKLKLRLCVRPRRDNRPDKKPTKIPKPVYYRRNQSDTPQSSVHHTDTSDTQ